LHDGLGAHLTAARFALARVENWLPADAPPACGEALALASSALDAVCDASQQLVADRHPPQSDAGLGLVSSLSHWAAEFGKRTQLRISFVCAADLRVTQLAPHATMEIYRVAQESLNNVAKHAHASNVTVIVASDRRHLTLKVTDDGRGIARGARAKAGRFGLSGMRQRCEDLGGSLKIVGAARSHPRAGTTLTARFAWSALLDGHAPPATERVALRS
jgi:signal transduction histidine kinase